VPDCPTILGVYDVLSTRCTVICLPPDNDGGSAVTGYCLERRSPGLDWIRVNDAPVPGLKHDVHNLSPLTAFEFRVAALNRFGVGSFSAASQLVTTKAPSLPNQPRWPVVVKLSGTSVTLEWSTSLIDDEVCSYAVRYGVPGNDIAKYSETRFDGSITSCTLTQLRPKTMYHFAVAVQNRAGCGPLSKFSECVVTHKHSGESRVLSWSVRVC